MKEIIEAILKLIPIGKLLEQAGISPEWSAGLSVLTAAVLLYLILKFIKWANEYRQNKKTAKHIASAEFTYKKVKYAREYYIETKFQNRAPTEEDEIKHSSKYIVKQKLIPWMTNVAFNEEKDDDKYYLILADSGMGKTTFMINLYMRYNARFFKKWKISLFPFGDDRIIEFLKEFSENREEAQNTILLLDAFDEYKGLLPPKEPDGLTSDERFRKRFDEIAKLTRDFREVVITSRSQYFPGEEEKRYELNIRKFSEEGFHSLQPLYLSPFDNKEIRKYLNKKYGVLKFWNRKKKRVAANIVNTSPKLMVRPMLLGYIDYLVDSNQTFDTTYQVYDTLITKWIERESNKRRYESTGREKFKNDLLVFSHKIALLMYENRAQSNQLSIDQDTAKKVCCDENLLLNDYEITGQSLLTRDANHNWKFAHKSIFEFFVAKEAVTNIDFYQKLVSFGFAGMDMAETFYQEEGEWIFVKGGRYKFNDTIDTSIPDFYIGRVPVTQKQWREVMGTDPEKIYFKGKDNNPVEGVSWHDAQKFIIELNKQTGKIFRLPSEAEWEYAARGGLKSKRYEYAGSNKLDEVGWYAKNSKKSTQPVAQKKPNELGIYDISGNVWEWCQDKWHDNIKGAPEDGSAWESGKDSRRVIRGGGWVNDAGDCQVAYRGGFNPDDRGDSVGFRLVFVP